LALAGCPHAAVEREVELSLKAGGKPVVAGMSLFAEVFAEWL